MFSMLESFWGWLSRFFPAPQRADFEASNAGLKDVIAALRQQVTDLDAVFARYREYTNRRIQELQTENEDCRRQRDADAAKIEALEDEVHKLRREVKHLREGGGA